MQIYFILENEMSRTDSHHHSNATIHSATPHHRMHTNTNTISRLVKLKLIERFKYLNHDVVHSMQELLKPKGAVDKQPNEYLYSNKSALMLGAMRFRVPHIRARPIHIVHKHPQYFHHFFFSFFLSSSIPRPPPPPPTFSLFYCASLLLLIILLHCSSINQLFLLCLLAQLLGPHIHNTFLFTILIFKYLLLFTYQNVSYCFPLFYLYSLNGKPLANLLIR